MKAIKISDLSYSYQEEGFSTKVLSNISLEIDSGELVAIQGPSGSGKSTILHLLGCLLRPQIGKLYLLERDISHLSDDQLARLRNEKLGFIFQQFHLLPKISVKNNILLPNLYSKTSREDASKKADELIDLFDLTNRVDHHPNQLSGGQQQRTAIARALLNNPDIILADEPTGNLDSKTAHQIMDLFKTLNRESKKTIIIITHDDEIAKKCDRIIRIRDGEIVDQEKQTNSSIALTSSHHHEDHHRSIVQFLKSIFHYLPQAISNLSRNKVRTALTMTGISVGIAAVLSMITLGQFTQKKILDGYAEMGVNSFVFYGYPNWNQKAKDIVPIPFRAFEWERDILPLKKIFPKIKLMSPILQGWGGQVSYGGKVIDSDVTISGVSEDAFQISAKKLLYGRNFVSTDLRHNSAVCMIGFEIGEKLFKTTYPLGQILTVIQNSSTYGCKIIGVLQSSTTNSEWVKPNLQVFLPSTFYQAISGDYWNSQIHRVLIQSEKGADVEKIGAGVRKFFEQKYGVSGEFRVDSDSILLAQMKRFLTLFTILLASVAFVTLGIGGIGITNMMLVSVSERYREIGLKKAIGATNYSIRIQFLSESIVICFIAGIIGILIGLATYHVVIWGASKFVSKLTFEWTFNYLAILFSFISIFVVGILSGIFPAMKAEELQVVEALRAE